MPGPPPPFDLHSARDAFVTAARLHAEATRQGTPNLRPEDLDALREADAAYVTALQAGRVDEAIAADDRFHAVLLERSGDPDLKVGVELLGPRLRRMAIWLVARRTVLAEASTHPPIIAALEAGDAEQAAELVQRSFLDAGERLAAAVERGD